MSDGHIIRLTFQGGLFILGVGMARWFLLVVAFVLVGCQSAQLSLIGKWEYSSHESLAVTPCPTPTMKPIVVDPLATSLPLPVDTPYPCTNGASGVFNLGCFGFPRSFEMFEDGTYAGDIFSFWGGGKYEVLEDGRLKVDTTYGMSVYNVSREGELLTLSDDTGCSMTYQKIS